jgi:hypothetical protein
MSEDENETQERGPGRPRTELGTAPKRSLRIHDQTWTASQTAAAELEISISEYARRALAYVNQDGRWKALTSQVGREK